MAIIKCKMCGGTLQFENGTSVGICEYCGSIYKQEKHDWVLTNISVQ